MSDLPILALESLERLAREQTRRLKRIQAFIASANAEIVAAREDMVTTGEVNKREIVKRVEKRYLAHVIWAMRQTLHQELLPLLENCADTVNAVREVVAPGQAFQNRKSEDHVNGEEKCGYSENDRRTARGAGMC